MPMKKQYLVVYDYSTGGIWGLARADNASEIERLFPQLTVVSKRPAWMNEERINKLRANSSFVIDDPSTYPEWLRTLAEQSR